MENRIAKSIFYQLSDCASLLTIMSTVSESPAIFLTHFLFKSPIPGEAQVQTV